MAENDVPVVGGEVLPEGPGDWVPPAPATFTHARDPGATEFLLGLARGLSPAGAGRVAGVPRRTAIDWRERDPAFAAAWDSARRAAVEAAEDTLYRRAVIGVRKPIVYQGQITGYVYEPSDRLLELYLKAERPDKYRERVDHQVTAVPLSPEALAEARKAGMSPEVEAAARTLAALPVVDDATPRDPGEEGAARA